MNTIPLLFEDSVTHFAHHTALFEPTDDHTLASLTYQELQMRSREFAGYLQHQNLAKGERIMIWSGSRIDWLIVFFGALTAGLVVVPLDSNTREDFLHRVARTTEARYLVTTQKQYESLKQPPVPFIDIDALPHDTLDSTQLPSISGDDLAELVFTSGTTGQPKGVMLSHNNIVSNAAAALEVVKITSQDRALSILPLSHMFELTIELALMKAGASIVYARSLSPETLLKLLSTQHATCMVLVPQALQLFLNGIEREVRLQHKEKQWQWLKSIAQRLPFNLRHFLFGAVHKRLGGHFRLFVSGGAYLSPQLGQAWEQMGFRILQGYGATECSPIISASPPDDHTFESVGKPLPGVEVRLADDGEILVHGPNVALGYWQNPEASAESFKNGWYYTGDLGYFDAHHRLGLKGRKKNLIVLANGLNVYPEDIENVLQNQVGVKEAVVLGVPDKNQSPEVHAVLLMDDPDTTKSAVQAANKLLASHQQIRGFTVWPEKDFPRTHTLKVKRQDVLATLQQLRENQIR